MRKKTIYLVITLFLALLMISVVSAGFGDWLKATITGKLSSQPTNVSVSIAGVSPAQIIFVDNASIAGTNPTENSYTNITFEVHVYDADSVIDLNDTSVIANFSSTGETTRSTVSYCPHIADLDANTANYSCSILMWYWDGNRTWNINVEANDLGNTTPQYNTSTTFDYNQLKAMVITPAQLTWPSLTTGATNQQSNNDPTTVNNTGNYDGAIDITGIDLYGETIITEKFDVSNFTADETDGQACGAGTTLVNASAITIVGTNANRGNLSAGAGQEDIYYCIANVPALTTQTYSTTQTGSWTVAY